MVKNEELLRKFEQDLIRENRLSYDEASDILDAMWAEGVELNVLPPEDPLEGIEVDIRIARVLNACSGR